MCSKLWTAWNPWRGLCLPAAFALCFGAAAPGAGAVSGGQYSPDGLKIVTDWPAGSSAKADAATVDCDTGAVRRLGAAARSGGGAWSPDGRWIVFHATQDGQEVTKLYDVRSGSSRVISRTFGPPYAWREDSRRLAGVALPVPSKEADPKGDEAALQIVFYNASERGESLRVAVDVESVDDLVWLPETDDVAFRGRQAGRNDVYAVEGGQVRKLTTTGDVLRLGLIAAGNELVWARSSRNTRYILLTLYAFNLRSRSVRRLGFPGRVAAINPQPSRSPVAVESVALDRTGSRIAVVVLDPVQSDPRSKRQTQTRRLFTVRTDGTGARLVRTITQTPGGARQQAMIPFWSWDGKRLGVVHAEAGRKTLLQYAADGSSGKVVARSGSEP